MTDHLIVIREARPRSPSVPEGPLRFGVFMSAADVPMFTTLGDHHPNCCPQERDLGPADDPDTWARAYDLHDTIADADAEADDDARLAHTFQINNTMLATDADGIMAAPLEDFRPILHAAAVGPDGTLHIADEPISELAARAGDDPEAMFRAAGAFVSFSRDEVYASHGATPQLADEGLAP